MRKKKTHEEFIGEIDIINSNIEVIGNYIDSKTKIRVRCKIDNYEWLSMPGNLLRGCGCPKCSGNARKTHNDFIEEINIKHPTINILGKYINAKTKISCKCMLDNYEWKPTPSSLLSGYGCPKCSGTAKKTHDEFLNELSNINPQIEILNKYTGAKNKLLCNCKIDNHQWYATPTNLIHLKRGCPECAKRNISKALTMTDDEFQEKLSNFNYKNNTYWVTNDIYKKSNIDMGFICQKDGYMVTATWSSLSQGNYKCHVCERLKSELKLKEHIKLNDLPIIILSKYNGADKSIECKCEICNKKYSTTPNIILSNNSIHKECSYKIKGEKLTIPLDIFLKTLSNNNNNVEYISGYRGVSYNVMAKCKKCDYIWNTRAKGLLEGKGCPNCNNYKGENFISEFLSIHNIEFDVQKTFDDLRGVGGYKLRYDFYLHKYNLLIEFQGIQHKKPVDFAGRGDKFANDLFDYQQEHDRRKREYARLHNIELLEIWYYDIDNIEEILTSRLLK